MQDHAGAAVAHDLPDAIPHGRSVAVDLAGRASALPIPEGATVYPRMGVFEELRTRRTKGIPGVMVTPAVHVHHDAHRLLLACPPALGIGHEGAIALRRS